LSFIDLNRYRRLIMNNRVVVITGASSGIGKATALRFAREKAGVVLVARREKELRESTHEVEALGGTPLGIAADVTSETELHRIVSQTVQTLGGIDVLVNAAGILSTGTIENTSLEEWDRLFKVNVRAPFYLMQCAMPHLIARKGCVINLSSITGIRAFPNILAYCSSKSALDQLTHCAALEVAPHGVRINAINPGVVITNLHRSGGMSEEAYLAFLERSQSTHPMGRPGSAEEVAELIFFLASPQASWITGASIPIDGGRHLTCAR
jgi:NAD(P)-dependent dehydrogenase (short-subunit alcohol dehydrogenase family)